MRAVQLLAPTVKLQRSLSCSRLCLAALAVSRAAAALLCIELYIKHQTRKYRIVVQVFHMALRFCAECESQGECRYEERS